MRTFLTAAVLYACIAAKPAWPAVDPAGSLPSTAALPGVSVEVIISPELKACLVRHLNTYLNRHETVFKQHDVIAALFKLPDLFLPDKKIDAELAYQIRLCVLKDLPSLRLVPASP
jgi:hypothetical protein